jgi:hypothetical protein
MDDDFYGAMEARLQYLLADATKNDLKATVRALELAMIALKKDRAAGVGRPQPTQPYPYLVLVASN